MGADVPASLPPKRGRPSLSLGRRDENHPLDIHTKTLQKRRAADKRTCSRSRCKRIGAILSRCKALKKDGVAILRDQWGGGIFEGLWYAGDACCPLVGMLDGIRTSLPRPQWDYGHKREIALLFKVHPDWIDGFTSALEGITLQSPGEYPGREDWPSYAEGFEDGRVTYDCLKWEGV